MLGAFHLLSRHIHYCAALRSACPLWIVLGYGGRQKGHQQRIEVSDVKITDPGRDRAGPDCAAGGGGEAAEGESAAAAPNGQRPVGPRGRLWQVTHPGPKEILL